MARDLYVEKNIRNPDPAIRAAVVNEALATNVTIGDIIGRILADAWGMEYESSGSLTKGITPTATQLSFSVSQEMATRAWLVSRARRITESSVIQELIAERYGLQFEPVRRGGVSRRRAQVSG